MHTALQLWITIYKVYTENKYVVWLQLANCSKNLTTKPPECNVLIRGIFKHPF